VTPAEGVVGLVALSAAGRALGARVRRRRVARRRLVQALGSESEGERLAAIRLLVEQGVGDHARLLWKMVVRGELDAGARATLAEGIARHSWEPTVSQDMARLRSWAATERGVGGSLDPESAIYARRG